MSAEPILIGADVGTTNIKVVAFDRRGLAVESASSPTPTRYPGPGRADHDPEELWTSFAATLRRVTGKLDDPGRVESIAVASVGEAAVPLDSGGDPTADIIAWFDGRARPQAQRLGRAIGQNRLFGLTGLSLQPIFGLCKLLWLKDNEPDAYSRTARWLNVADYMAFRLCGASPPRTTPSPHARLPSTCTTCGGPKRCSKRSGFLPACSHPCWVAARLSVL